jgi:predicted DNA-binding transcriptional regulator YafY
VARRRVEPYRLVTGHGLWYLVTFDPARSGWRTFRVDRITAPAPTHVRFAPREPPADAAEQVRRAITDAPYRHRAVVTVEASAAEVRARLPRLLPARLQPVGEHTCTVTLGADAVGPIVADLVALGAPRTLDTDDEVREQLRTTGRWLLDAAGAQPEP